MSTSPVPIIAMVMIGILFQAVFYGTEAGTKSFPTFERPDFAEGECDGVVKAAICGAKTIMRIISTIWAAVVFVFDIITFNIPGSPFWARIFIATMNISAIIWLVARLIRGGG